MRDPDPRRRASDELAALLSTPEGLRTARLLQLTEALQVDRTVEGPSPRPDPAADDPRPIGIWQPRQHRSDPSRAGLTFVRPAPLPLGDHYAKRRSLNAVKEPGVTRVCFFGESVAAGYLFAPHLTPAGTLQRRLLETAGETSFEVIDLARTNETLRTMTETVNHSLQLAPDLLVLFVGNNWNLLETPSISPYVPSVRGRQRYALALRRSGLSGPVRLARRDLKHRVQSTFGTLSELARPQKIPVLVVIPEVNLADWEDRQPVAWLPGDGSARWHRGYLKATRHLEAGQFDAALTAASDLLTLDEGQCPTTHRLRATALAALGCPEEAREACEAEVDAGNYATMAFLDAPRISSAGQQLLRDEASRRGFAVVDLPRIFRQHTGDALPDRRLFLDYCHLTAEGIEVAMAAVAAEILKDRDLDPAPAVVPRVLPKVDALAKLGAAIHGAHRLLAHGDKQSYIEHWCRDALAQNPAIAAAMRDLLTARCAPCPAVLTPAQQHQLAASHPLLLQHGWRWDGLDPDVIAAICTTLEEAGHEVRKSVEDQLLKHHGVGPEGRELSRPPYLWEPLERFYPEVMSRRGMNGRATLRSPWPSTRFCLITDATTDITLDVTARLPAIEGSLERRVGNLTLEINARDAATLELTETWERHVAVLPQASLRRGINRLDLAWPTLPACGEAALEQAIRRLENGREADLHPVFGEIFSLTARRP